MHAARGCCAPRLGIHSPFFGRSRCGRGDVEPGWSYLGGPTVRRRQRTDRASRCPSCRRGDSRRAPAFAIRKPAVAVFTLDDYVAAEIMTSLQTEVLRLNVATRSNILVAGGTSTGKMTQTNALLAEMAKTSDRVVIIEDTRELQCAAPKLVAMRTKDDVATLSDLVHSSLRLRPDRIPLGEVRGSEALDMLKAWGTGHFGGIGTIHAGSGIGTLRRLKQLIQEAVITVPRALIAATINLVPVLAGRGSSRRLVEPARVDGLGPDGDYAITPAITSKGDPS